MRLLYLAHSYPPSPAVGAVRAWNTARWLAAAGWEVTVVTPAARVWRHPDEPRTLPPGVRRLETGHAWPMLLPDYVRWVDGPAGRLLGGACRVAARKLGVDPGVGWRLSAEKSCAALRPGEFDLVLATGGPYGTFRAARRASERLGCPFVMDYRDPWSSNPHGGHRRSRDASSEEKRLLADCAGATVVSPSWARLIGTAFGVSEKVTVVSNGYDPDDFAGVEAERFGHFAVVYAGTLYPPKRVLDPVLRALREVPVPGARLHYYGDYAEPVRAAAARLGADGRVVVHGRVPRRAALAAQKGADLLVVVASVEEEGSLADKGVVTGKVFDCMALGRPALVVAPRGSDLYGVAETAGGMRCFTGSEVEAMTQYMGEVAAGRLPPRRAPEAYRWDSIGRTFDAALRAALA